MVLCSRDYQNTIKWTSLVLNIIKYLTMNVIETSFVILLFCGFCFAQDQNGRSTRYWDCCKASCGWLLKADFTHPVWSCAADGVSALDDFDTRSGCDTNPLGTAFSCANNQPWAVDDTLAYGFAAASISGQNEAGICCACYELTFTTGPVSGQRMVVQVTNTGGDLGANQFDIQIPGGGVGIFNGCTAEYGAPADGWGSRYGGVSSRAECSTLPTQLQAGCQWRFDWFKGADNPEFTFHRVSCPGELTGITGCIRSDEP